MKALRILLLSPYHGGSHRAWAEGFQAHSHHQVQLLTLPARFWRWRMHGGAVTLARAYAADPRPVDLILATDMVDLTTFLALTRRWTAAATSVLYMHENQLTYPLHNMPRRRRAGYQLNARERHYAFINFASMLAADHVLFNSAFHRRSWFGALPNFLKHYAEENELDAIPVLRRRSSVLPVGVDLGRLAGPAPPPSREVPLILWNQRWEYDKNPAAFFRTLYRAAKDGLPFRLALCGENPRRQPAEFLQAIQRLGSRVVHVGFAAEEQYRQLLYESSLVISTAYHEYFGISMIEAMACRTFPLLPRRLSYPEIIPADLHPHCLYSTYRDLQQKVTRHLENPAAARPIAARLADTIQRYAWRQMAPTYDDFLANLHPAH